MYVRKEVFLACRYELEMKTGSGILVDVAEWSMETYKVVRCQYGPGQNETRPCESQCDLKLVKLQGGDVSQPVVSINCTLYNDKLGTIQYGSIQCSATSIVRGPTASTTETPSTISQHPSISSTNDNTSNNMSLTGQKTISSSDTKPASPTDKLLVMNMQGPFSANNFKGLSFTNETESSSLTKSVMTNSEGLIRVPRSFLSNIPPPNGSKVTTERVQGLRDGTKEPLSPLTTSSNVSKNTHPLANSKTSTKSNGFNQDPSESKQSIRVQKVWYQCAEVTLNNDDKRSDRIVRVFMRYFFIEKKEKLIEDSNDRRENRSEINEDPTERGSLHEHGRNNRKRMHEDHEIVQSESTVDSKYEVDARDEITKGDSEMFLVAFVTQNRCPVMCPSEHLTTPLTLIDGTEFLAPISFCFEAITNETSHTSSFTGQLEELTPYLISAAVVCLIILSVVAVRYYTTSRQVFYIKGRTCADGAVEESEEAFNLEGSCSEITTTSPPHPEK
ncbi:hypothetical protein WDU94_012812 [Cyamophila willieti]